MSARGRCMEECSNVGLYTVKECSEYCSEYEESDESKRLDEAEGYCSSGSDEDCPFIEEHG